MSLDQAIEYLQLKATTNLKLAPPSTRTSNLILDATNNVTEKQKKLVRDAEPHESQIYAINVDDAVPGRRRGGFERPSLIGQEGSKDIERLLTAATNLNKVCNFADIQEIIERFRQEQDTHQTDLDYLNATYNENKIEIERLTKAAKRKEVSQQQHQQRQNDPMDVDTVPNHEAIRKAEIQAQLEKEIEELQSNVNQKKNELEQSSEKLRKYQETTMQESVLLQQQQQQQEEEHYQQQPAHDSTDPSLMDSNASFSNIHLSFQEILENPTTSYADKLSTIRRELLLTVMEDSSTEGMAKVMAKVVQLLEQEPSHRILLDHLKQSATEYANELELSSSAGTQAIYKLNAYKLVIIDRSEEHSLVQLA
ncbi:hypothetical protein INT45_004806 [Circinella minor]|uniref:Uncharacterized protein n=1 Tax=Circinella minor TaxID=1195481 RepID=A0A8H7RV40_9FUNG|nr:hypothetical protein INT45_004806 [Circinella minor]